jgi:hypothetical protein
MLIITALEESCWGEVFTARIIGDDGDATLAPDALIVCCDVVGRIAQLNLPRHDGDGDFVSMRLEVRPFIRMGRLSRVAQGQFESEFGIDIGRLLVQVAKDPLLLGRVLGVDMMAAPRLEVLGDLRAVAPQLTLGVSSEVRPFETQGRHDIVRQRQECSDLLVAVVRGALVGDILDFEQSDHGLAWLACFGGELTDLGDHVGTGTPELESLGPAVELLTEGWTPGVIKAKRWAALAEVGTPFETRMGGLELAISREQLALDEAELPEEVDKDGHGSVDSAGPDTTAEVAQIVLARDSLLKASEVTIALAFVVLA